jgi:hypothetical protein
VTDSWGSRYVDPRIERLALVARDAGSDQMFFGHPETLGAPGRLRRKLYDFLQSNEESEVLKDQVLETAETLQNLRHRIASESRGYLFTEMITSLVYSGIEFMEPEDRTERLDQILEFANNFPDPMMQWFKLMNGILLHDSDPNRLIINEYIQ